MDLWNNPRWFDDKKRQEQLDDHIRTTGKARFGIREFEEEGPVFSIVDEDVLSIDTMIGEMEPSVLLR